MQRTLEPQTSFPFILRATKLKYLLIFEQAQLMNEQALREKLVGLNVATSQQTGQDNPPQRS